MTMDAPLDMRSAAFVKAGQGLLTSPILPTLLKSRYQSIAMVAHAGCGAETLYRPARHEPLAGIALGFPS